MRDTTKVRAAGVIEIEVDVAAGLESATASPLLVRGSVFLPPPADVAPRTVFFCAAGRSYDRSYFNLPLPGYSFADYAAARGHIVVAFDYLGVGRSTAAPEIAKYTSAQLSAANHAFASDVLERLRIGTLTDGFPAAERLVAIGVGHSMGGFLSVRQQALHRTFDGLASLGWGLDLSLHFLDGVDTSFAAAQEDEALLSIPGIRAFIEQPIDRAAFHDLFYWDDIPDRVIALDQSLQATSIGLAGAGALVPDFSRKDVAAIDVPVFLAFGERDVSANPRNEPSFYETASDITLFVLPNSAHCHNLASTRQVLWQRLTQWAASVSAPAPGLIATADT